jgi:NHL repeat-containing protein
MNYQPFRLILVGLFVCLAMLLTQTSAQVQQQEAGLPTFQVDPFWPKPLPNNWYPGAVSSVAVDSRDHIWIVHRPRTLEPRERGLELKNSRCCVPAPPVLEFDPNGTLLQGWGGPSNDSKWLGEKGSEHGIYVDDQDNVWISEANGNGHVILKFTRTGKFLLQIGELGKTGGSNDQKLLGAPANVTVDTKANEVYVADGYGNRRVIVFDASTGAYKRHWGAYGNRPDDAAQAPYDPAAPPRQQFSTPVHCVRIARDGLVYVCDRSNNRVQVFRKEGTFVSELIFEKQTRELGPLCDIAFSRDADQRFFYIADCANDTVHIVSRKDLKIVGAFGQKGRHAGQIYGPHFLSADSRGNLYIAEVFGRRVQKFEYKGLSRMTQRQ